MLEALWSLRRQKFERSLAHSLAISAGRQYVDQAIEAVSADDSCDVLTLGYSHADALHQNVNHFRAVADAGAHTPLSVNRWTAACADDLGLHQNILWPSRVLGKHLQILTGITTKAAVRRSFTGLRELRFREAGNVAIDRVRKPAVRAEVLAGNIACFVRKQPSAHVANIVGCTNAA